MWHSAGYDPRSSSLYTLYQRFACLSNPQPRMYADDTHLTLASNDITHLEQGMNEDLAKANEESVKRILLKRNKPRTLFNLSTLKLCNKFTNVWFRTFSSGVFMEPLLTLFITR